MNPSSTSKPNPQGSEPNPQGSDRFEYKVMGSMLELYCDAVVDLLSKGASPEAQFTKKSKRRKRATCWFLRDFFMFLGCMIHGFLRKFSGLNHAFREINVHVEEFEIYLICQCAWFSRGFVRHSQINGTQLLHSQNQWSKCIFEKLKLWSWIISWTNKLWISWQISGIVPYINGCLWFP